MKSIEGLSSSVLVSEEITLKAKSKRSIHQAQVRIDNQNSEIQGRLKSIKLNQA